MFIGRSAPLLVGAFAGDTFGLEKFFSVEKYNFGGRECLGVRLREIFDRYCGGSGFSAKYRQWCRDLEFVDGFDVQKYDFGVNRPTGRPRHDFVGTLGVALRVALSLPTTHALFRHLVNCFGLGWVDGLEAQRLTELRALADIGPVPYTVDQAGLVDVKLHDPGVLSGETDLGPSSGEEADPPIFQNMGSDSSLVVREFDFKGRVVRTVVIEGHTWYVVHDVCVILELSNPTAAVARLEPSEKGLTIIKTLRGDQEMLIVSESGLYGLVLRSRKPEARAFRFWMTSEVIPAIARTGRFESKSAELAPPPVAAVEVPALSAPSSWVLSETAPITLAAFLHMKGLKLPAEWSAIEERNLARLTVEAQEPNKACLRLAAGGDWLFSREALTAWWAENAKKAVLDDLD